MRIKYFLLTFSLLLATLFGTGCGLSDQNQEAQRAPNQYDGLDYGLDDDDDFMIVDLDDDIFEKIKRPRGLGGPANIYEETNLLAYSEQVLSGLQRSATESFREYVVQENDTLMLIAYKIYGDYRKWIDLYYLNSDRVDFRYTIFPGMKIRYQAPGRDVAGLITDRGFPYLVRDGDNLGKVSKNVYDNVRLWPHIWDNNRKQVRDPNLIFAGFTLYYRPIEELNIENTQTIKRELASLFEIRREEYRNRFKEE